MKHPSRRTLVWIALVLLCVGGCTKPPGKSGSNDGGTKTPPAPCTQTKCGTACVNLQTDPSNCGACGQACPANNTCQAGVCAPEPGAFGAPCTKNGDCNSQLCLQSGHCSKKCSGASDCPADPSWTCAPLPGYPSMCQCTVTGPETCDGKDDDCDGLVDDGATCPQDGNICISGACQCPPRNQCGGSCMDTSTNPYHCGSCSTQCQPGSVCINGKCSCPASAPDTCPDGCVNRKTYRTDCGTCGNKCPGGATCKDGQCQCPTSQPVVCSNISPNHQPLCVSLHTSQTCGNCDSTCLYGDCISGTCVCPQGTTLCSGECANTKTDTKNCGACGTTCIGGTCSQGYCLCPTNYGDCSGTCVDLRRDPNCGACGHSCLGQACQNNQTCQSTSLAQNVTVYGMAAGVPGLAWTGSDGAGTARGLWLVPSDGSSPARLLAADGLATSDPAVVGNTIYWTSGKSIASIPSAGGTETVVVQTQDTLTNLRSDGQGDLLWSEWPPGASSPNIMILRHGSSTPETLVSSPGPSFAVADGYAIFQYQNGFQAVPVSGGSATTIYPGNDPDGLGRFGPFAAGGTWVYALCRGIPNGPYGQQTAYTALCDFSITKSNAKVAYAARQQFFSVVADSQAAYFSDGAIMEMRAGTTTAFYITGGDPVAVTRVAVGPKRVFFVSSNNIHATAK